MKLHFNLVATLLVDTSETSNWYLKDVYLEETDLKYMKQVNGSLRIGIKG